MSFLSNQLRKITNKLFLVEESRASLMLAQPKWSTYHQFIDLWVEVGVEVNKLNVWAESNILNPQQRQSLNEVNQAYYAQYLLESQDKGYRSFLWAWVRHQSFKNLTQDQQDNIRGALSGTIVSTWPKYKQQQLNRVLEEQQVMEEQFKENLRRDQSNFGMYFTRLSELNCLPKHVIRKAKLQAKEYGWTGWWFEASSENVSHFKSTKISATTKRAMTLEWKKVGRSYAGTYENNSMVLARLSELRRLEARLHGKTNYGIYAWSGNVFNSPRAMSQFLRSSQKALEQTPNTLLSKEERTSYHKLHVSPQKAQRVLFSLLAKRFNLSFEYVPSLSWLPQLPRMAVKKDNKLLGYVVLDIFSRPDRENSGLGGFMIDVNKRHRFQNGRIQLPTSYVSLNSNPKKWGHRECLVFFHEMGHVLHHLSCISEMPSSNWSDIEQDGCEWPSLLLESWGWQPEVVTSLFGSRYHELFNKIERNQRRSSLTTGLQVSWMDLRMHASTRAGQDQPTHWARHASQYTPNISKLPQEDWATWDHLVLMQGAYSGYLWSEQIAENLNAELQSKKDYEELWQQVFATSGSSYVVSAMEEWRAGVTKINS
jgi:Zn-dependent oligopeptidase